MSISTLKQNLTSWRTEGNEGEGEQGPWEWRGRELGGNRRGS